VIVEKTELLPLLDEPAPPPPTVIGKDATDAVKPPPGFASGLPDHSEPGAGFDSLKPPAPPPENS
jgi:hypothetical protein